MEKIETKSTARLSRKSVDEKSLSRGTDDEHRMHFFRLRPW